MPLTPQQARDDWILGSFAQYLGRTVVSDYNPIAAATSGNMDKRQQFPKPLKVLMGKPDDITVVRAAPSIVIDQTPAGERERQYGIGTNVIWRFRAYTLYCYPSLDANGAPCDRAHQILRSLLSDAWDSEAFRIIDYTISTPSNVVYTGEVAYLVTVSAPIDRSQTTALAEEKHRFDFHVTIRYPVAAQIRN